MSMKAFFGELKAGLKAPAYLIYSDEPYFLKTALFKVKETMPEAERDFHFHVFDMDSSPVPVEHVIDILRMVALLPGRKVVAVEGVEKLKKADLASIAGYISSPSPDSTLIMFLDGDLKDWRKEALSRAKTFHLNVSQKELPSWVRQTAIDKGVKLTADAVDYLVGAFGREAGLLSSEIDKLAGAGKATLDASDIAECVKGIGGYSVFNLADALIAGDEGKAFRIYRSFSETQEPYSLIGALNWRMGKTQMSREHRERIFGILNEADIAIKSSGTVYPVEYMLLRLLRCRTETKDGAKKSPGAARVNR